MPVLRTKLLTLHTSATFANVEGWRGDCLRKSRMKLPHFLIIGAPKAATTWLSRYLRAHPAVFMPPSEIHYFDRYYGNGTDWYSRLFERSRDDQVRGEKSATYLASLQVPERIFGLVPKIKLIAQLRNPIDRAYSDYCMLLRRGDVSRNMEDYLDPARASKLRFIADGEYGRHLTRWLSHFPREQFFVLLYEDIKSKPTDVLAEVSAFLQIEQQPAPSLMRPFNVKDEPRLPLGVRRALAPLKDLVAPYRKSPWFKAVHRTFARPFDYPPLPGDLRAKLNDHFSSDIDQIEKILGREIVTWRELPENNNQAAAGEEDLLRASELSRTA